MSNSKRWGPEKVRISLKCAFLKGDLQTIFRLSYLGVHTLITFTIQSLRICSNQEEKLHCFKNSLQIALNKDDDVAVSY